MNDYEEFDQENLVVDNTDPMEKSSSSPGDELPIDEH